MPVRSSHNCCHAKFLNVTLSKKPRLLSHRYALIDVLREIRRLAGVWLRVARHLAAPFFQRPHGARGNVISELWLFHPTWWRRAFREDGFELIRDEPMGLFYTGNMTFGSGLSLSRREKLAKALGSACHLYQMHRNSALRALHQRPTSAKDPVTPHGRSPDPRSASHGSHHARDRAPRTTVPPAGSPCFAMNVTFISSPREAAAALDVYSAFS
jgi:hypothetical protein